MVFGGRGQWTVGERGELIWQASVPMYKKALSRNGETLKICRKRCLAMIMKSKTQKIAATTIDVQNRNENNSDERIRVVLKGKKIEEQIRDSNIEDKDLGFSSSFTRKSGSTFYISQNENCGALLKKVTRLAGGSLEDLKIVPRGWRKTYGLQEIPTTIIMDIVGPSSQLDLYIIDEHKKMLRQRWTAFLSTQLCKCIQPGVQYRVYTFLARSQGSGSLQPYVLSSSQNIRRMVRSSAREEW